MSYLDEHGYPTDEALEKIKRWPNDDFPGLMAFVKELWWVPDWGWSEETRETSMGRKGVNAYLISTGGWSGNEDLIGAMRGQHIFWMMCWYSSRRGGHFEFELPIRDTGGSDGY